MATEGWSKTKITVTELAKKYEDMGISHIIFTDIDKDGVLEGVRSTTRFIRVNKH